MEDSFKDNSDKYDAFKDYRYNDENQFNPDPDAAIPTEERTEEQEQETESTTKIYSVLEAKRIHFGHVTVRGKIISRGDMYVIEVSNGPDLIHRDARFIQLEDTEKLDEHEDEHLEVILYDDLIENVIAGEIVEIEGLNQLQDVYNKKSKKKMVVLHAESIKYVNKKEFVITEEHIKAFEKFAKLNCEVEGCQRNLLKRLIAMFAPNVIGHDDVKLGLLRSIVGGDSHGEYKDGFIDTFMVGDHGTAKEHSWQGSNQDKT